MTGSEPGTLTVGGLRRPEQFESRFEEAQPSLQLFLFSRCHNHSGCGPKHAGVCLLRLLHIASSGIGVLCCSGDVQEREGRIDFDLQKVVVERVGLPMQLAEAFYGDPSRPQTTPTGIVSL